MTRLGVQSTGHRDGVAQRVVGVRVVHHDDERLPLVHSLEPPRDGAAAAAIPCAIVAGCDSIGEASATRSENVVHIDPPDERGLDGKTLLAALHFETQPLKHRSRRCGHVRSAFCPSP